jgi:hypothetical protein
MFVSEQKYPKKIDHSPRKCQPLQRDPKLWNCSKISKAPKSTYFMSPTYLLRRYEINYDTVIINFFLYDRGVPLANHILVRSCRGTHAEACKNAVKHLRRWEEEFEEKGDLLTLLEFMTLLRQKHLGIAISLKNKKWLVAQTINFPQEGTYEVVVYTTP